MRISNSPFFHIPPCSCQTLRIHPRNPLEGRAEFRVHPQLPTWFSMAELSMLYNTNLMLCSFGWSHLSLTAQHHPKTFLVVLLHSLHRATQTQTLWQRHKSTHKCFILQKSSLCVLSLIIILINNYRKNLKWLWNWLQKSIGDNVHIVILSPGFSWYWINTKICIIAQAWNQNQGKRKPSSIQVSSLSILWTLPPCGGGKMK